jgi:PAS domain S-box-containing protein
MVDRPLRILMLEDNRVDAELIAYELRKGGLEFSYELVETEDGYREALKDNPPDIILSDYELPTFDGISALIIAQSVAPDLPFVFVTGVMGEDTAIDMLRRGATDYVLKHRLTRLVPAVRRALDEVAERRTRSQAEAALQESEERYRTIFESAATANCIIDGSTKISFVNRQFARLFKREEADVVGGVTFIDLLDPEGGNVEDFKFRHASILAGQGIDRTSFESKVRDVNGNALTVYVSMGMIPNSNSVVVSLTDITREKLYEEELEERAERLSHFLVVASHELRHPVTVIKGYASTLGSHGTEMSPELIEEIYRSLEAAADRLSWTVGKLMDVSTIDTGQLPPAKERVEIERLCAEAIEKLNRRGLSPPVEIRIASDARDSEADPGMLIELLYLLLENAAVYSEETAPVEIDVGVREGVLRVSVSDSGVGIPEEDRERVFDRFYQVEDAIHHSRPGLGIGLYIARKIVTAHGGEIWCEPREGGGTTFSFILA